MKKIVKSLERLQNSRDGNPRFRIHFTDGTSLVTKTDTSVALELGDSFVGRTVEVEVDGRGNVWDVRKVDG